MRQRFKELYHRIKPIFINFHEFTHNKISYVKNKTEIMNFLHKFKNFEHDHVKKMLLFVIFFFCMSVIFSLIKYVLKTFKYSPPHEPILSIMGIIIGRLCWYIPKEKRCIDLLCENITEWLIVVIPLMFFRICYFTEFSRNSKILTQTIFFGILGTAISSTIIGIALKIIEKKDITLQMALVLGLVFVPIYPKDRAVKGFGTTLYNVDNFLDGESLVGIVTSFYLITIILWPPNMETLPLYLLKGMAQLIVGSAIGWVSGMMICRLMVNFSDLTTVILMIFFMPLTVTVFVHCLGFNEDLAIIIQVLLICKNRASLRKETEYFYGEFICLVHTLVTDMTLVYLGILIGEEFTAVELLVNIPYVICMYVIVMCGRFFSFAVLSFISNKSDWGLSLSQLGLVIWCGGPSIINVLMLLNFYQDFGFEKSNVGKEMTRNLFGVVVLGYLINTWCTSPILSGLGLMKSSLAMDVNSSLCFRWIMETRQRSILILKLERWFGDSQWNLVKKGTELVHPYWKTACETDRSKEVFRFAVCNRCTLEFFVPPSYKEYQEMTRGARRRVLKAKKNFYIEQYNIGMLSEDSYRLLTEGIEKGLESPDVEFNTNKLLNMIRRVNWLDDNSQKLCNNYEYSFRMMCPKNISPFRKNIMDMVIHPLFDLSINLMALLNLAVDVYYFIYRMDHLSRNVLLAIYSLFLAVYLTEYVIKMYFFRVRMVHEGVLHYFCSPWNLIDASLLVMTLLVVLSLCYSVFYELVLAVATVSTLRFVRLIRLLRRFEFCKPFVLYVPKLCGDMLAVKAYETGKTFIKGEHELMALVPGMVKDPHITADILRQMDEDIVRVVKEVEQIQQNRPKIAINIKTKQAIQTVLNLIKEEIDFMKNAGWIDDIEYKWLLKSVYERYQYLHSLRKVKYNSPKTFFEEIPWLKGSESVKEYLFDNIQTRRFASKDVIVAIDEHASGVYIVISGLLIIEYVPELKVLEQLELFGALPVIDFITDVNFRDDRKDYIVAGNTFGELSILTKRPYSCHVVADSACEVLFIPEESIRKAMIMDNDPIKGPYRTTPQDEVRLCLDRSFMPKLTKFSVITRSEFIEDIILIEGSVMDSRTHTYFMAPRHLPRSIQNVFLPGHRDFSLDTVIETKLVLVTIPGVNPKFIMERQREYNDSHLHDRKFSI